MASISGFRCWVLLVICCFQRGLIVSAQIRSDEHVLFFPTAARWSEDRGHWTVPIHGWIYEPEADDLVRRATINGLRRTLGLDPASDEAAIFADRCRRFLVDNERGKQLSVQIGEQQFPLETSEPDGHFQGQFALDQALVARWADGTWLKFQAVTSAGDKRTFAGAVRLIPAEGVSVISDIDDTVKVTEVNDRRQLLANTLLRPFRPVEGMPQVYQRWSEQGAVVHFVSSSPWQLYEPLNDFLERAGFPRAVFHLRRFRLKGVDLADALANPMATKRPMIESLLQAYPQREFVLVGDSGQQDPELYGSIARQFPAQVRRIDIRDVTGDPHDGPRYHSAFHEVPRDKWQIFVDPTTLPQQP